MPAVWLSVFCLLKSVSLKAITVGYGRESFLFVCSEFPFLLLSLHCTLCIPLPTVVNGGRDDNLPLYFSLILFSLFLFHFGGECHLWPSFSHYRRPPPPPHLRFHPLSPQRPLGKLFLAPTSSVFVLGVMLNEFGEQMWPGLVASAKEGGADAIETYVFWNGHELSPGNVSRLLTYSTSFDNYFSL